MGNCYSAGGWMAVGGGSSSHSNPADGPNDAVDYFLTSRGYRGLFSQIELSLSASNLRDRDVLSKSDPMAVVYTKGRDSAIQELGRTEIMLNSLNPKWIRKHTVTYHFEVVQTLVFRVYDVDTQFHDLDVKMLKLDEQQFLGEATCKLSEIVTKSYRSLTLDLVRKDETMGSYPTNFGTLTVHAEESVSSKTRTELVLRCSDLESRDLFSRSDPFLVISKTVESGIPIPICKTEVLKNDHNPSWKPVFLNIQQPLNTNFHPIPSSSASNGNPRLPDSLHYIDPSGRPNAYQRAILEVGEVLQFYDSDKRFPSWGFGARPIDGPVSHCFNLNGSSNYCEVEGIQGIMKAYTSALFNVSLAGPTLFGPVITTASQIARQSLARNQQKYFVLLIITDGVITDLQETKDALVTASDLPLSILIVGVGGADFKEMEILDADKNEKLESSNGRIASRDIVQFVPLQDVQSGEVSVVQTLLAELPSQFLSYMRTRDIHPNT
ncbi:Protein BONZAI like [Actinidia chinensis var. chinensis]|uniref:Protein BONZAI like n=1 Tax=Actinidia chinensis var. chinensis TaxID=1590841 RepID=A0A2R6QGA1_ACTCC|nr:Protein BONZAI like [Actinidia chinensis var. chinensis]